MSTSNASLNLSAASEAIVSADGRIKRRIPNHETTFLHISKDGVVSNVFEAVNDNKVHVPVLSDSIQLTGQKKIAAKRRHGVFVLGTIVFITFLWSVYSIFLSSSVLQKSPWDMQSQILSETNSQSKLQVKIEELKREIALVEDAALKEKRSEASDSVNYSLLEQRLSAPELPRPHSTIVNKEDVQMLLDQYKIAYENGDIQSMIKLFGVESSGEESNGALFRNFKNIFSNTSKRSINFYDYQWNIDSDKLVIKGKYNSILEFGKNKGAQHIVANMRITAFQTPNQLIISIVELTNKQVNSITPHSVNFSVLESSNNRMELPIAEAAEFPNATELNDLTTEFVAAYEAGDIEKFVALFSRQAKTNDQETIAGIKEDYQALFNNTSDRRMFIKNLNWVEESNSAKGIGDLEVTVLSDTENTESTFKGKIQIVARKIGTKLLITHLYHIEHQT